MAAGRVAQEAMGTLEQSKTVYVAPFGKARPRVTRNGQHTYMSSDYVAQKDALRLLFGRVEVEGLVQLSVTAVRAMPASWAKKRRFEMAGKYATPKPDLDNIVAAVMDSLWSDDDSCVVEFGPCKKIWGFENELRITIRRCE